MMKLIVLGCVLAAVVANPLLYVAPVAIPVQSSIGYALQQPYNSARLAIKTLDNGIHALKKRSVTRLAVAPGPVGYSAALAAGNIGISTPITFDPTGLSSTIANPIGISSSLVNSPFGISNPILASSAGLSVPLTGLSTSISASSVGLSASPFSLSSPIAVSAPISTGSAVNTSPIAIGTTGVPTSTVPVFPSF